MPDIESTSPGEPNADVLEKMRALLEDIRDQVTARETLDLLEAIRQGITDITDR